MRRWGGSVLAVRQVRPKSKQQVIDAALDAALVACARKGHQLTDLRSHVLRLILAAEGPSTAYQLLDRLKEHRANATPPTIYRVLDFLVQEHLIHKVERLNAFVPCAEVNHARAHPVQFLICRQCGTVAEIEDAAVSEALEHAAHGKGFHTGHATVEVEGTCAHCYHAG